MAKRRRYTVMVQRDTGYGTIWVSSMTCRTKPDGSGEDDIPHIENEARRRCAIEWDMLDQCGEPEIGGLICMAIARGTVQFVTFDDSHLGE